MTWDINRDGPVTDAKVGDTVWVDNTKYVVTEVNGTYTKMEHASPLTVRALPGDVPRVF